MEVVTTTVGRFIQLNRIKRQLSVEQLAGRVGVSASMLKKYECGACQIPLDVVNRAADVLHAPSIKKRYSWEHDTGVINVPILDGIDEHPIVVLTAVEQELAEFLAIVRESRDSLVNKRSERELSPEDRRKVESLLAEGIDVYAAIEVLAMVLSDVFSGDIHTEEKRYEAKCRKRGYVTDGQAANGNVVPLFAESQPTYA